MKLELDDKRQKVLDQAGHLLVLGGPGSGKTTIALLKAKGLCKTLRPGQEVLFLSFSRAAVRQIQMRCRDVLTRKERDLILTKTYHAFCIETLQSYGRILSGMLPRFVFPREERVRRAAYDGKWEDEVARLRKDEGRYCFDVVADGVARLFEGSTLVRDLYARKFPLVIVDEFQDTDDSQWRIVRALSAETTVFCLADPDQRIFDYRSEVDPKRIDNLRGDLGPAEFDLGSDNHRSPNAGILAFADAVLRNLSPLPTSPDVRIVDYFPNGFSSIIHREVIKQFANLRKSGITQPTVAVLCRSNPLVAQVSALLSQPVSTASATFPTIEHSVVWDAELTVAAATVVGSVLEWPTKAPTIAVADTLQAVAVFYKLKNAQRPSQSAAQMTERYEKAAVTVRGGGSPAIKAGKTLLKERENRPRLFGDPAQDWLEARSIVDSVKGLEDVAGEARMMRLFRAKDEVGGSLADAWLNRGTYGGAVQIVERALDRQILMATDQDPRGCVLMSMHKSKGKEFDGVLLIEGTHTAQFFDSRDKPPYDASRRLLRVGITRARKLVTIIRPKNAAPKLVD